MSYNGSGTFVINSTGQPVVTGTVISSSTFNSLTADLGTGLSTAITKDGQTTTTAKIPFAQGLSAAVASNFAAGTVGAPSIYLSTDTTTGLYRIGANNVGFAVSGTKLLDLSSALMGITGALTVSTTLGVTGAITSSQSITSATTIISTIGNSGTAFSATSATTGYIRGTIANTSGDINYGVEGATANVLATGTTAYDAVVRAKLGLSLAYADGTVGLRISNAGAVTIPGTLGVTGLITATNTGIAVPTGATGTCHSGTYTPTLTNGTNVASSSPQVMQFMRVGNTVTVGGYINIDTTATGASSLRMSLPVPSNFTSSVDAGGVGSRPSTAANDAWNMYANSATDDIQIDGYSTTTAAENLFITLVYQVK